MTQLLEPKTQTFDNRNLHKFARLLFLLMYPGNAKQREAAYIERFPFLHRTMVWKDLTQNYPALRKLIEDDYPALLSILRQMVRPSDMRKLPVSRIKEGKIARMNVDIVINLETDTITWFPFKQDIFDETGKRVATVHYDEGSTDRQTEI